MSRRFQCLECSNTEKVPMSRRFRRQEGSNVEKIPTPRRFQCLNGSNPRRFECQECSDIKEVPVLRKIQFREGSNIEKIPMTRGFQCRKGFNVGWVPTSKIPVSRWFRYQEGSNVEKIPSASVPYCVLMAISLYICYTKVLAQCNIAKDACWVNVLPWNCQRCIWKVFRVSLIMTVYCYQPLKNTLKKFIKGTVNTWNSDLINTLFDSNGLIMMARGKNDFLTTSKGL